MFVRSKELFPCTVLDGLKTYPSWVQNLILKGKLDYYPFRNRWVYFGYDGELFDGDLLVKVGEKIIAVKAEDVEKNYEVLE